MSPEIQSALNKSKLVDKSVGFNSIDLKSNLDICYEYKSLLGISCSCDNTLQDHSNGCCLVRNKIKEKNLEFSTNSQNIRLDRKINENHTEVETLLNSIKKSLKNRENLEEIKKQLQIKFGLFLEGHTDHVASLAVTSDNKYIISGSKDKTIRIWNLLQKRQVAVLDKHTDFVRSVVVTTDNKYIIFVSDDKTIRV